MPPPPPQTFPVPSSDMPETPPSLPAEQGLTLAAQSRSSRRPRARESALVNFMSISPARRRRPDACRLSAGSPPARHEAAGKLSGSPLPGRALSLLLPSGRLAKGRPAAPSSRSGRCKEKRKFAARFKGSLDQSVFLFGGQEMFLPGSLAPSLCLSPQSGIRGGRAAGWLWHLRRAGAEKKIQMCFQRRARRRRRRDGGGGGVVFLGSCCKKEPAGWLAGRGDGLCPAAAGGGCAAKAEALWIPRSSPQKAAAAGRFCKRRAGAKGSASAWLASGSLRPVSSQGCVALVGSARPPPAPPPR